MHHTKLELALAEAIVNIVEAWGNGDLAERVNEARQAVEAEFGLPIDEIDFIYIANSEYHDALEEEPLAYMDEDGFLACIECRDFARTQDPTFMENDKPMYAQTLAVGDVCQGCEQVVLYRVKGGH